MYICNAYQLLPSNSTEYAYRYRELGRALVLSYDGPSAQNIYNQIATEIVQALDAKLQHVFKNSYCMQNESSLSYEIALQLSKWHNNTNLKELFGKNVEESLIAADFKVLKNGNKTDFIFNPLSILTPGKTRNFFDIWE